MGMNIAGGAAEVQAQALEYGLTPAEVAQAAHGTASYFGGIANAGKNMPAATAAAAPLSRGAHNAKNVAAREATGRMCVASEYPDILVCVPHTTL